MKIVLGILAAVLALALAYVLFLTVCALLVDRNKEYDNCSRFYFKVLNSAVVCAFVLVRLRVKVSGMEKVPEGRFLLVGNHYSNADPIITWYIFRKNNMAFVSKAENFRIPVFGRIIRRCAFLPIDRESPREAMKTIMKAAELIKRDAASVGIYPEGTRNRTPEKGLLPFHNGVFKIAQIAKAPIVVVTLQGTENIHKNYPLRRTDIRLDVQEVIPVEEIVGKRTADIGARVEKIMSKALEIPASQHAEPESEGREI